MIRIIYRSFFSLIIILLLVATYLSIVGIKTDKLNSKIISQINEIEPNIKVKLNDVSAKLDIFNFGIIFIIFRVKFLFFIIFKKYWSNKKYRYNY